jgi:hypothetical protein
MTLYKTDQHMYHNTIVMATQARDGILRNSGLLIRRLTTSLKLSSFWFVTLINIIELFDYTVQCDSNVYMYIYDAFACFGQIMTIIRRQITFEETTIT